MASFAAGAAMKGFEGPELDRLSAAFSAGIDIGWNWRATEEASYAPVRKEAKEEEKRRSPVEEPQRPVTQPGLFSLRKEASKERAIVDRRPAN